MHARPALEPSWTTPCTGISAAGGISEARIASSTAPPPMPKAAVRNEVAKLAATTSPATVQPRPA